MVLVVPPQSCRLKIGGSFRGCAELHQAAMLDQVRHGAGLAAQPDQQIAADVGVLGETGQDAIQLLVILAAVLQAAAPFVRQRQNAVDVREAGQKRAIEAWAMYLLTEAEQFTVEITAR